ncbi:hypothetical protein Nepgr_027842 [Nepenthes gracilis]|uniref:Translocator protein n=1 Tax=Nepenthes gracilis TaxID=150966 RepID=A0AAD3TBP0_NEPGR|nr:hypothetical protein Nepgr_027842 [Nepenthes gracilis]
MDSSNHLKQRIKDGPTGSPDSGATGHDAEKARRIAMAKRGLRSLSVAASIPPLLTLADIYLFGSSNSYKAISRGTAWLPPLWALHMTCLGSAVLMGLSAWLVWAEGGFHRDPSMLLLYLTHLGLSLVWDPILFSLGATWSALLVSLTAFVALLRCGNTFRRVNPIAADLVMPCLAWAAFLAIVNLKLLLAS